MSAALARIGFWFVSATTAAAGVAYFWLSIVATTMGGIALAFLLGMVALVGAIVLAEVATARSERRWETKRRELARKYWAPISGGISGQGSNLETRRSR